MVFLKCFRIFRGRHCNCRQASRNTFIETRLTSRGTSNLHRLVSSCWTCCWIRRCEWLPRKKIEPLFVTERNEVAAVKHVDLCLHVRRQKRNQLRCRVCGLHATLGVVGTIVEMISGLESKILGHRNKMRRKILQVDQVIETLRGQGQQAQLRCPVALFLALAGLPALGFAPNRKDANKPRTRNPAAKKDALLAPSVRA